MTYAYLPAFDDFIAPPTEDKIERRVSHYVDHADAKLMNGLVSQADYDAWSRDLNKWADKQYARVKL